jgi:predicted phosphodiesterase
VDGEDAVTMTVHYADTPKDERIAQLAECDILLFGQTHRPWVREYGGVLFVNCGSVGKPKDGARQLCAARRRRRRARLPRVRRL